MMFRLACTLLLIQTAVALGATDDASVSPVIAAPLRSIPANLPKKQATDSTLQIKGVDAELNVGMTPETSSPSVFDGLATDQNSNLQKAQLMLKRNLLDEVSLTYKNNVGLANATQTTNGAAARQSAQSQSASEINWAINEAVSLTGSNQMDQIFEFQRSEPTRTRNALESRYSPGPGTVLGLGASNENFYQGNIVSFERETVSNLYQQKLGKLPLTWSANPSYITETNPFDSTQNRTGTAMNQSLLWNITPDFTWNVGGGVTTWDYSTDLRKESDRNLFSQWTRQLRKNLKMNVRTDLQTTETNASEGALLQREERFKLSLGQQLLLTDDVTASFDIGHEYLRQINSTWSPSDHSATLSIQKKF